MHPILKRHQDDIETGRKPKRAIKNIQYADFQKFIRELRNLRHGEILSAMATVQYAQALRISEVAALYWEDIFLDLDRPEASRLSVTRSVIWLRSKGLGSFIREGFKNSEANDGCKEQPLFPEAFFAQNALRNGKSAGLVFEINGGHFGYRLLEFAYNKAFKQAGLPPIEAPISCAMEAPDSCTTQLRTWR